MDRQQGDRPKSNWIDLDIVTAEGTDLAIRVQTTDAGKALYSYEFGRVYNGKFFRSVRAELTFASGQVTLHPFDLTRYQPLLHAAEAIALADAQRREAAFQARRGGGGGGGYAEPRRDRDEGRGRRGGQDRRRRDHDEGRW